MKRRILNAYVRNYTYVRTYIRTYVRRTYVNEMIMHGPH